MLCPNVSIIHSVLCNVYYAVFRSFVCLSCYTLYRPNEFLPTEFSVIRGLEQKMYKEQEKLKHMKTHKAVHKSYINTMMSLLTYNTVFFPVRVSV